MKSFFLLCLCFFVFSVCFGQAHQKIRLLYSSADITNIADDTMQVKRIRVALHSNSIIVRLTNKTRLAFPTDRIWGYREKGNVIYHYYQGEFYRVMQVDTLVVYAKWVSGYKSGHYNYYLSIGLNQELHRLDMKNLKNLFAGNLCFLQKMRYELKWYQDYSSYDYSNKSYRVIEFFKDCIN